MNEKLPNLGNYRPKQLDTTKHLKEGMSKRERN